MAPRAGRNVFNVDQPAISVHTLHAHTADTNALRMADFRFPFSPTTPPSRIQDLQHGWLPSPGSSPYPPPQSPPPPRPTIHSTPVITPEMSAENSSTSFQQSNILFIVNGGTPCHRGFKTWAHQILLQRTSPATPPVTRMIYFNPTLVQYVVQEITTEGGRITSRVSNAGASLSEILTMQQSSDLVFIFSSTGMIPLSPRSPQLKRVPHILIFVNERNAPLPKDIFDAAHRFHRLKNVAILYQTAGLRETLGHCTVLHLEGCMQRLRPRGEFDGRSINRLVEWRDLSQVDLGSVLQRLVLRRNPRAIPLPASEIPPSSSGEQSIRESRGRMGVQTDGDEAFPAANSAYITATEETESETLAANRVRRISELFTTGQPGAPAIIRLQEELRTEHRRNSRIGVAVSSIPSSPQEPFIVPTPSPNDDAFRGECQLCCEEDTQLVFLLKESLSGDGWLQNLPWPLSVGAEPVNDVISAFLCCDNCSYYVIEMGSTPIREKATGAFSLIPYTSNTERWKEDLCKGFVHYGHSSRDLLPLVLLTVVDEILRSKSWAQLDGSDENELRRNALLWTRRTVLEQVHIKGGGHEGFLGEWICSEVLRPGKEEKSMVWNYPLKGFRLFLRIAGEREAAGIRDRAERLGKVLWRRLLMEVTRCYRAELAGALDINFDATLRTVVRFSRVLRGEDDTGNWLRVLDEKKVLPEGALEVLDALEEEMEWVLNNCRYAMVKWLSWVPEALGVKGSTGEVMRWIVDVQCGDVVVMCPEDVDQSWCMGFGAEAELMSRYVYSRFGHE